MRGGRSVGHIQIAPKELNLGQPRTNPEGSKAWGWDPEPADLKPSALTTRPHGLQ